MAKPINALDYLSGSEEYPAQPVCVLFGDDSFLKRQSLVRLRREVLGGDDGDFSLSVFQGRSAVLPDVLGELTTVAMFGSDKRLIVVEQADEFVSRYRQDLEDYTARPSTSGVLVLEVKAWPGNTKLYKIVAAEGLAIDCKAPAVARLAPWLGVWARESHNVGLTPEVAELLIDLVGPELGLLDQELAKLALVADLEGQITLQTVRQLVGTWRARTTWEMLDAVLDGKVREAMTQLDRLLLAGENPIAILGQISASLRRLAAATRLVLQAERAGRKIALGQALREAGVRQFLVNKTQRQLRLLGRHRGGQLYRWLLQADLDLKGASSLPPRLILERLIVRIAATEARQ